MKNLGVKGIHIAERDTQRTNEIRPTKQFWNTWSVDGLIVEGSYILGALNVCFNYMQVPVDFRKNLFQIYVLKQFKL